MNGENTLFISLGHLEHFISFVLNSFARSSE
jgi:hypothetical protein